VRRSAYGVAGRVESFAPAVEAARAQPVTGTECADRRARFTEAQHHLSPVACVQSPPPLSSGCTGLENPLRDKDNNRMLFGDAKKILDEVLVALKA
jgi:hypothetical protein